MSLVELVHGLICFFLNVLLVILNDRNYILKLLNKKIKFFKVYFNLTDLTTI